MPKAGFTPASARLRAITSETLLAGCETVWSEGMQGGLVLRDPRDHPQAFRRANPRRSGKTHRSRVTKLKCGRGSADNPSMDISAIAGLATQLSQQRASQTASLLVAKKAMDAQQSGTLTLIASVKPSASLPAHLGQNINTVA